MWNAENNNVVNEIIKCYGHDAVVVYNMMVAAVFDQIDDTDIAEDVVAKIKNQ
jgi:hypothetical protein